MRYVSAVVVALLLSVSPMRVGAQSYQPSHENPAGPELVVVYLTASTCLPCRGAEMPALLDSAKVQLQRQAKARGQYFRAVFVAMDWEPEKALELAKADGIWDELDVGRNWSNIGAELYVWGDTATIPALPQLIVYEQNIAMSSRVDFGPRRVLQRILGPNELKKWVAQGSPIPTNQQRD